MTNLKKIKKKTNLKKRIKNKQKIKPKIKNKIFKQ